MKKLFPIVIVLFSLGVCGCYSYYPAMSTQQYDKAINELNKNLGVEGFTLTMRSTTNGYYDMEHFQYQNKDGETLDYTLNVHRGDNDGVIFIDTIELNGCSYSNPNNFDRYCGQSGIINYSLNANKTNDTQGKKFSPGKTVGAIIGGTVGVTVALMAIIAVAAATAAAKD